MTSSNGLGLAENLVPSADGDAEIFCASPPLVLDGPVIIKSTGSNELPSLAIGLPYGKLIKTTHMLH